jgi:predicted transcriptional regulator
MEQTIMVTKPSRLSKARIEALGEETAEGLGYSENVDIVDLVASWGHKIVYSDLDEHPESLVISADGVLTIYLPRHTSRARDRFTVAHELGHYILHHNTQGEEVRFNRSGSDLAEIEANWFAAAFLMPEEPFRDACRHQHLHMVAYKFNVSLSAAEVRAQSLGICTS